MLLPGGGGGTRTNALWGRRGESRPRFGPSGRARVGGALAVLALSIPLVASAGTKESGSGAGPGLPMVSKTLLDKAQAQPSALFSVIVQGKGSLRSAGVAAKVAAELGSQPGKAKLNRQFKTISGVSAQLTGAQVLDLAKFFSVAAITEDGRVRLDGLSSGQQWPYQSELSKFWDAIQTSGVQAPTVAIVDSGIDSSRADFGGRVVKQVTMTSLVPNSPGDGCGHGTFVAGVLAGAASGYAGGAANAKIVSLDVMDDSGMAITSDVIAAADWIYQNKDAYGIKVANFS